MAWRIRRKIPQAGPHSLGPEVVQFDAAGEASTTNPAVMEQASRFPAVFSVVVIPPAPPDTTAQIQATSPDAPADTRAALAMLTVAALQRLAARRGLVVPRRRLRKEDWIALLLPEATNTQQA
jgi:hypothetical protein